MADAPSESGWKAFTKKHKLELDDKDLLKALAKLDKTDESRPEPRLQAAQELVEQGRKQVTALAKRKKEIDAKLGAKAFDTAKDELYTIIDGAEKIVKQARDALKSAPEDEEAESPALLTTKMVPLIRELRKGEVTMQALVALAGKETVVLISRRAISPARGKLLKEQMSNPSGLKFMRGECLLEQNALTFVMQGPAGGLAKRLKAALLAQTDLRLKVRVRGETPDDVEEEGEDEGDAVGQAPGPTTPPTAPPRPQPGGERQRAEDAGPAFKARMTALVAQLKDALAAGHPGAQTAKLKASEAGVLAGKRDFARAGALLDEAEQALQQGRVDEMQFRRDWARAAEGWRSAVAKVDGQIARLQGSMRGLNDPELDRIGEFGLPALTGNHKARLMAAMMDIENARGAALKAAAVRVGQLASDLAQFLDNSQAVKACDENPFGVQVSVRETLHEAAHDLWQAVEPLQ